MRTADPSIVRLVAAIPLAVLGALVLGGGVSGQNPEPTPPSVALVLQGRLIPLGSPGTIELAIVGREGTFSLGGEERTTVRVPPGAPLTIERIAIPAGATPLSMSCAPPDGRDVPEVVDEAAGTLTVTPDPGEFVRCVFRAALPRYDARVTVRSEPPGLLPDGATLTASNHPAARTVGEGVRNQWLLPLLLDGARSTITLGELPEGVVLDRIECTQPVGSDAVIEPDVAIATIALAGAADDRIECDMVVTPPSVALVLQGRLIPLGSPGTIELAIVGREGTFSLGGEERTTVRVPPGAPLTIERIAIPAGATPLSMSCAPPDGRDVPEVVDEAAGTLTVTPDPGEFVRCVFRAALPRYDARVTVRSEPPGLLPDGATLTASNHPAARTVGEGVRNQWLLPLLLDGARSTITLGELPEGVVLDRIECTQPVGSDAVIEPDVAIATIALAGAADDRIECDMVVTPPSVALVLQGRLIPLGSPGTIELAIVGREGTFSLGGEERTTVRVPPGAPLTIERIAIPAGATPLSMSCAPPDGRDVPEVVDEAAGTLTVTPDPGEFVRCVFRAALPRYDARVTVRSEPPGLLPDGATLTASNHPAARTVGEGVRNQWLLPLLLDGARSTITLGELPEGVVLDRIECTQPVGSDAVIEPDVAIATIALAGAADDRIECDMVVTPPSVVIVAVETDPPFEELFVDVELAGDTVTLGHGESATDGDVPAGIYPIVAPPSDAYRVSAITCLDDTGTPVPTTPGSGIDGVTFEPSGGTTTCKISVRPATAIVVVAVETDPPFAELFVDVEMAGQTVTLGHGEWATDDDAPDDATYPIVVPPNRDHRVTETTCLDDAGVVVPTTPGSGIDAVTFVPADGTTTCTVTVRPNLATVIATIDAGDEPVEVPFVLELGESRVDLLAGDIVTDPRADPDLYRAALVPARGFRLDDIVCVDAGGQRLPATLDAESQSIAFAPGIGATIECTFLLTPRIATVTVIAQPDVDLPDAMFTFQLGDLEATVGPRIEATDERADPDLYRIALLPVDRHRLLDIACRDDASGDRVSATPDGASRSIAFAPGIGTSTTCTFELQALIATVAAYVDDGAPEGANEYELDMDGMITLVGSQLRAADEGADPDGYAIALLPNPGPPLEGILCVDADGEPVPMDVDGGNRSVAFRPGIGRLVTCAFILEGGGAPGGVVVIGGDGDADATAEPVATDEPDEGSIPAPRPGRWRAVNLPGTISCDGFSQRLPRSVDDGTIEVRRGGRRLIGQGLAEGRRTRIVLDADPGRPGRWRGDLVVRQQGASVTLDYVVDFVSRTRLEGRMTGDFRAAGQRCRLERDFTLTRRGN